MHGIVDKAGLELGVHRRSAHHANLSNISERKSSHPVRSDKGNIFSGHQRSFSNFLCLFFQGQYSLARAQQSFKSLVQIHEKNGENNYWKYLTNIYETFFCSFSFSFFSLRKCLQVGLRRPKKTDNAARQRRSIPK